MTSNASVHDGEGDESSLLVGGQDKENSYNSTSGSTDAPESNAEKRQHLENTTT